MSTLDATLTDLLELPAELSAKARAVPGLPERLLRFIRMEVAMNERRQQRYSPEALAVVQRARALVEKRKTEGTDRAEAMRAFEQREPRGTGQTLLSRPKRADTRTHRALAGPRDRPSLQVPQKRV